MNFDLTQIFRGIFKRVKWHYFSTVINGFISKTVCVLMLLNWDNSLARPKYLPGTFNGFNSEEKFEVNSYRRFDSETESDILTFRPIDCSNQYLLGESGNFLCSSLGSLGSKRFLVDHLFLFTHEITEEVDLRIHWVKDQDYTRSTDAQAAELFYNFSDQHSLGVHGQFDTMKSSDDLGLSYNFSGPSTLARLEVMSYDFSRNNRNEDTDRFTQKPLSLAASFLQSFGNDLYYLRGELEPQFIWDLPSLGQVVKRKSERTLFFANFAHNSFSFEWLKKLVTINADFEEHRLLRGHWQKDWQDLHGFRLQTGFRTAIKQWNTLDGQLEHLDLLPFFWYQSLEHFRRFRFGYEFTVHKAKGDVGLQTLDFKSSAVEHRGNVALSVFKTETSSFDLLFTLDLDRFGSGETWEGGNGQFTLVF